MLPYKTLIEIDKKRKRPLYLQISDRIATLIKKGTLPPKSSMPGSRRLANILEVNRQTVVAAYEELEAQGWLEVIPKKGTFVKEELPIVQQRKIQHRQKEKIKRKKEEGKLQLRIPDKTSCKWIIDRGSADDRLAPIDTLARAYRFALKSCQRTRYLSNIDIFSQNRSEEIVSQYLNRTRGLQTTGDHIMLTQGSQMGIFIAANLLISKRDKVVIGQTSYKGADDVFRSLQADLIEIEVDKSGLDINQLEAICKKEKIKCVYVTPHHHLPTTVTLSAARRMQLLELASRYDFMIIEDDYDFDYHYKSSPLLPLASSDEEDRVIYVGSMSKNIAPGIRFGYLAASSELIVRFKLFRRSIDRYGDLVVERAITDMIKEGEIERHLRKCLKIYRERRDHFCFLLKDQLGDSVQFDIPQGGLAIWAHFNTSKELVDISKSALQKDLFISNGTIYSPKQEKLNATRMGFASLNKKEMEEAIGILKQCI